MHNIKLYFLIINNLSTISTNMIVEPFQLEKNNYKTVYEYSQTEIAEQKKEASLFHQYFFPSFFNRYKNFINQTNQVLSLPAAKLATDKFDNLYDKPTASKIWNDFIALNNALTKTKLSNVLTLNLNWNDLLQQVKTNHNDISNYDQQLLRFYNIAAKLYGFKNLLQLVQRLKFDPSLTSFTKTYYYQQILAIDFWFNRNFANQNLINQAYSDKRIATNNLIVSTLHNYGQALIFYVNNNIEERQKFNIIPIDNQKKIHVITKKQQSLAINSEEQIFHDVTGSLINYLVSAINVQTNNDAVKQLLIPLLVVNSTESRKAWITNTVNLRDNFFDEAFSKWIGTESSNRDYSWQLLNEYFMNIFPNFYNLY